MAGIGLADGFAHQRVFTTQSSVFALAKTRPTLRNRPPPATETAFGFWSFFARNSVDGSGAVVCEGKQPAVGRDQQPFDAEAVEWDLDARGRFARTIPTK